jgi:CHAT domain
LKLPGNTVPNLQIELAAHDDSSTITFSAPGVEPLKVRSRLRERDLRNLRLSLRDRLTQFARSAHKASQLPEPARWGELDHAMQLLRIAGQNLGYALIPSGEVQAVQEFCREACRWQQRPRGMPAVELIVGELGIAPLEFLPLFRRASAGPVVDARSFEEEARSYLGFSAIVKRTIREWPNQPSILNGYPKLRASVFRYANLRAVSDVVEALGQSGVAVAAPQPSAPTPTAVLEASVCRSLLNGTEQILYFGCHCNTLSDDGTLHELILGHDRLSPSPVTLGAFGRYFYSHGPRSAPGPLVFINACGGAAVVPAAVTSFPGFFLEQNFRGCIGTEAIIPDRTAAEFASQFFRAFLDGTPLGESLLTARRKLLYRGNPLGILYTAYAASEMLVRRTRH